MPVYNEMVRANKAVAEAQTQRIAEDVSRGVGRADRRTHGC